MLQALLLLILAYLVGSVNFGWLIAKVFNPTLDLTKQGSGNIGATNVLRNLGPLAGLLTFIADAGKGLIMVAIASQQTHHTTVGYLVGLAVVIGHVKSFWLILSNKPSGYSGKGVATSLGVILALQPSLAIMTLMMWLGGYLLTNRSGMAAVIAFSNYLLWQLYHSGSGNFNTLIAITIALIVLLRHNNNIKDYFAIN